VTWLSNLFQTTLSPGAVGNTTVDVAKGQLRFPGATPARSSFTRYAAIVFLLMGFMNLYGAVSPIAARDFELSGMFRMAAGVYGVWAIGLAYGVYRRKLWAWRLGLVFIASTWLMTFVQPFPSEKFGNQAFPKTIFTILSLGVVAYWCWWWYAQRIHFERGDEPTA